MPDNEFLADRVRPLLSDEVGCAEKKMFGGIGFLLQGNLCVGVRREFLILRLGPEQGPAALRLPWVQEFNITGKSMKGWVMISETALSDDGELRAWLEQAVKFAGTLPAK